MPESPLNLLFSPNGAAFSKQQSKIAGYLSENLEKASYTSAQRLGAEIGVDPSTIVRFAQSLGYQGFRDLQAAIRETVLRTRSVWIGRHGADGHHGSTVHSVISREISNLQLLSDQLDIAMLQQVVGAIARARRTVVLASGSNSGIGLLFEHLGRFVGYNVTFENRASWHSGVLLSQLTHDDLLIAVTFWWGDRNITDGAIFAAAQGVPMVAITDQRYSSFARSARFLLTPPSSGSSFSSSITAATALVYGLIEMLAEIDPKHSQAAMGVAEHTYKALGMNAL